MKMPDTINGKTPEEIKKGLCCDQCYECPYDNAECTTVSDCLEPVRRDALAYIQQLERERDEARFEVLDELSCAYYGKQMYGLNEDGTVYSRYSCETKPFEEAVTELARLLYKEMDGDENA